MLLSFIVRAFYVKRSFSLIGKTHIASIIPILAGVVFLVIMVVKSSLALSLGLVGALSIVRFRTPIKEPEELVYLFLAIAVGLGMGAGQPVLTTLIVLLILIFVYLFLSNRKINKVIEYNMIIDWGDEKVSLETILRELESKSQTFKLVRYDWSESSKSASLIIEPENDFGIDDLIAQLKNHIPSVSITFFEAKTNW
jgi:uncharacterized membrane protein YhiD involved in acid resistance